MAVILFSRGQIWLWTDPGGKGKSSRCGLGGVSDTNKTPARLNKCEEGFQEERERGKQKQKGDLLRSTRPEVVDV